MYKIALINMPFGGLNIPSLALTQLSSALYKNLSDSVNVDIFYLNHDFGVYFGVDIYQFLSDNGVTTVTGLTDWIFRAVAFPKIEDNASQYLRRYKNSLKIDEEQLSDLLYKRSLLSKFFDDLISKYNLSDYAMVGFTSMFDQSVASFAMAGKLKKINKDIITVLGGASCELSTGEIIAKRIDQIDFVFSGPSLKSFVQFVENIIKGEIDKCHKIRGVYSRCNLDWIKSFKHHGIGEETDINDRLSMNYSQFLNSLKSKIPELEPQLFFETSRGCWWGEKSHCTFCGLNGVTMNYRAMSAQNAIDQFNEMFEQYKNVPLFFAVDNILAREYFDTVLPYIKVPESTNVFYETKLITNENHMKVLMDAGITKIQPGIESLSSSVLKIMRKGTTAFQNIIFLKASLKYGIMPDWNLLIGFPRESEEVYEKYLEDIPGLVHLPAPGATFPVRFDRYSPYHNRQEEYDLDLKPLDFYQLIYPFPYDELNDYAYFFADHNYDNSYILHLSRWRKKVEASVEYWNIRWRQVDNKLKPVLKFVENSNCIYDSRTGDPVEYSLSALDADILKSLDQPMGVSTLKYKLNIDSNEIEERLCKLKEYNLLFQEGETMLSVVC
jgi:ribosomal peptide maturation radical SAM protein 1